MVAEQCIDCPGPDIALEDREGSLTFMAAQDSDMPKTCAFYRDVLLEVAPDRDAASMCGITALELAMDLAPRESDQSQYEAFVALLQKVGGETHA